MKKYSMFDEILVDNFAGGGGAGTGISLAVGRSVDIAINHDPAAIAMHKVNHPYTDHYCESVWDVDPRKVTAGRPVALCWFSPDCKHFSKAKGGKPVEKKIRGLAWIVLKWAARVHPRVIMLENVEEFQTWGPVRKGKPVKKLSGVTFSKWKSQLEALGYKIEHRELKACDYGAPTIRKRFFLIARRDGRPISWPKPTHGHPDSPEVKSGKLKPWRTAAEIIDWSLPCPSIFGRKKLLAENTLRRIARGLQKFVIENSSPFIINYKFANDPENIDRPLSTVTSVNGHYLVDPFIVKVNHHGDDFRGQEIYDPLQTITAKNGWGLVAPLLVGAGGPVYMGKPNPVDTPLGTVITENHRALATAFLAKHYGGYYTGAGNGADEPLSTITTTDHNAVVAAFLSKYHGETSATEARGQLPDEPIRTIDTANRFALVSSHLIKMRGTNTGHPASEPLHTITAGGLHLGEVRAFLLKYYGTAVGQSPNEPLHTITSRDTFGLVTIHGQSYQIVDIGMRMLEPHELFAAQGFPADYIIDRDCDGKKYSKSAQVARCGNAVPPPFAEHLVRANLPELCGKATLKNKARYASN